MSGGEAKIQVRNLFPTPVATVVLPDAGEINPPLKAAILAREESHPGTQHSNLGGWQSDWEMETWGGPALLRLLQHARTLATRLTTDRQGRPVQPGWKVNCWANVNRSGHGNEFHTHPGSFWSGTYYVEDGGCADNAALGGELELQDPRGVAPVMYAPLLTFAGPAGAALGASEVLRPRSGLMVLFPAWLQHAVRPYKGNGTRISIAFNLSLY